MKEKIIKPAIFKLSQIQTYQLGLVKEEKEEKLNIKRKKYLSYLI